MTYKNTLKNAIWQMVSLTVILALVAIGSQSTPKKNTVSASPISSLLQSSGGVALPVKWEDLGKKMVETGVIDAEKLEALYKDRARLPNGQGGFTEDERSLLYGESSENLIITQENSGFLLNLLWAFGLSNKNSILEEGPMVQYGDPSQFASTGGWTLTKDETMNHYSRHAFISLTGEQQELVERVSKNIYRPCCNNPTYFPDCNHGMAMLGLLELMASQGASEEEMYRAALVANTFWFPDTYLTIEKYLEKKELSWNEVEPKEILGFNYSSASGYQKVLAEVPPETSGGASCGI
ncbi:MAG: hypothetical protein HYW80_01800 [Parcubacteria group bacterium]|nr:hypothetical protein [Parcubacteria group bacterium]